MNDMAQQPSRRSLTRDTRQALRGDHRLAATRQRYAVVKTAPQASSRYRGFWGRCHSTYLVAVLRELLVDRLELAGSSRRSSSTALESGLLALVESLLLDNTLGLELVDSLGVLPARLEAEHTESVRNDQLLLAVVRLRHTLVDLEALESSGTTGSLVGNHTADSTEEDARRSAVVERTVLLRVDKVALVHESVVLELFG